MSNASASRLRRGSPAAPAANPIPRRPLLHEIHARAWVRELSRQAGRPVTLAAIPDGVLAAWAAAGFTHLWLMGVWTTGARARQIFLENPEARAHLAEVCPGWSDDDVPGSPYAVASYDVDPSIGGRSGLAAFRARLHAAGLRLILDFVPNHVGIDHSWVAENVGLLVHAREPRDGAFRQETADGPRWVAHGRDPWFPPWTDTAQLDLRNPATRERLVETLCGIAEQCDGVRCDMAMLGLREVFERTWEAWPGIGNGNGNGARAEGEFWSEAIASVRRTRGEKFLFLAEAYWDREEQLLELGFDLAYDKRVLDYLVEGDARNLGAHLAARGTRLVPHGVHFLENHDEPRIAGRMEPGRHQAAAMLTLALPGWPMLHDGQLSGARVRASVHLARRPAERGDPAVAAALADFYSALLAAWRETPVGWAASRGELRPVHLVPAVAVLHSSSRSGPEPAEGQEPTAETSGNAGEDRGNPGEPPAMAMAVTWSADDQSLALVVVNPGATSGFFRIELPADRMAEGTWEGAVRLVAGVGAGRGGTDGFRCPALGDWDGRNGQEEGGSPDGHALRLEVRGGANVEVRMRVDAWVGWWIHLRRASFL